MPFIHRGKAFGDSANRDDSSSLTCFSLRFRTEIERGYHRVALRVAGKKGKLGRWFRSRAFFSSARILQRGRLEGQLITRGRRSSRKPDSRCAAKYEIQFGRDARPLAGLNPGRIRVAISPVRISLTTTIVSINNSDVFLEQLPGPS